MEITDECRSNNHRLTQRNGTHLSMFGDTSFARGSLAETIRIDGEDKAVEDNYEAKLQGTQWDGGNRLTKS